MKALYIPLALLALIVLSSLTTSSYLQQRTEEWIALLEQCDDFLSEEQWERTQDCLLTAHANWEEHATVLHMILEHQDLDEAEQLFAGAFAACQEQDIEEFRIFLRQLTTQLQLLAETQVANLQNIL